MRVLVDKFLSALGSAAPQELNKPQTCPGCQIPGALIVTVDQRSAATIFHCSTCRFHGDAVQFIAFLRKESITDALASFATGGVFAHTLQQGFTHNQLEEYTKQYHSQDYIQRYLDQAHQALASRAGTVMAQTVPLFRSGSPAFPHSMGYVLDNNQIPPELANLDAGTYRRNKHFSFAYTYNKRVVGLLTRELRDLSINAYINLLPDDIGVFMEDVLNPEVTTVDVAPDELAAAVMYARAQQLSTLPLQIVAVRGLPLPASFRHIRQLNLLSFRDRPLLLHTALHYLASKDVIEFGDTPECFVVHMDTPLDRVSPEQLQNAEQRRQRLATWVAHELIDLHKIHGEADVIGILSKHSLSPSVQTTLQNSLQIAKAPDTLIQLLEHIRLDLSEERRLTNGKRVLRTINGFLGYTGANTTVLSDTMFKVDECVLTRTGEVRYNVTVFCQKSRLGPLKVTLTQADFRTESTLKSAIQNAFIARGEHLAITFYNERGYDWSEIRDSFSDKMPVIREIEKLGADEFGTVHFTHCAIDGQHELIRDQRPLVTFSPEVARCYQAISSQMVERFDGIPYLWKGDTPEHAALAAGLSHIFGQILSGVACKRSGVSNYPQHLVYVDLSTQTWMPCMKQLATICAGTEYIPHIPQTGPLEYIRGLADLDCLPYICQFPVLQQQRAKTFVQQSPVSLLTIAENEQGGFISPEENVWFFALEQMSKRLPGLLPNDLVALIQREFATLLMYFLNVSQTRIRPTWLAGTNPIVQVYDWIAAALHIENEVPSHVANMCKKYYVAYSYQTTRAFLHELKRMFFSGGAAYTAQRLIRGTERPTEPFAVFEDRRHGKVYVHHHVVDVINQQNKRANFNKLALTQELEDAHYLAEQTTEPYWILHEDVWQTHVANQIKLVELPRIDIATA